MDDNFFRVSMRYRLIVSISCSRTISKLPFENVLRASLQFFVVVGSVVVVCYLCCTLETADLTARKILLSLWESLIHCNVKRSRGIPYII